MFGTKHHKHKPRHYHKALVKIAYHVDAFRLMPRFLLGGYSILFWQISHWFMVLPNPTIVQGTFVTTIVGLAATLFAFYTKAGRNPVNPEDQDQHDHDPDVIPPIVPIVPPPAQ